MSHTQTGKKNKLFVKNMVLLALVVAITIAPLVFFQNADFGGADEAAEGMIRSIAPNYTPWLENIWEPPSGEVENLLFVVQGALGAGLIGYCIGYWKGRKKRED